MTVSSSIGSQLVTAYLDLGVSFDRFIVLLFGIGILYIVGQLITHFSYDVIPAPFAGTSDVAKRQGVCQI